MRERKQPAQKDGKPDPKRDAPWRDDLDPVPEGGEDEDPIDKVVDDASNDSFPASDPPPWSPGSV